jgi:hypothetical protein
VAVCPVRSSSPMCSSIATVRILVVAVGLQTG